MRPDFTERLNNMRKDIDEVEFGSFEYHILVAIMAVFSRIYALSQERVDRKIRAVTSYYTLN